MKTNIYWLATAIPLLGGTALSTTAAAQEAATQLQRLEVEAGTAAEAGSFTGYAAEASVSATKSDTPLEKTPQAVSVVGAEQIEDQAARTVGEATRYSPGIRSETFGFDPRNEWFLIRGFSSQISSYFLDGLQLQSSDYYATWKINPYLLERIDILRGPSSALYGGSNPGGLINLVTKRPQFRNGGEASVGVNEFGNVWSGVDVQGVNADGTLAARIVATGNVGDTEFDYIDDDRFAIMPTVTWKPNADTSLTVYAHYSNDKSNGQNFLPYTGTVTAAPFGYIPRDLFTGEPAVDKYDREQAMVGYEFEHSFNDQVTVRQNLRYARLQTDILGFYGTGYLNNDPSTGRLNRGAYFSTPDLGLFNIDNQVEVKAETGPLSHTMLFGLDYKDFDLDEAVGFGSVDSLNLLDPDYGATPIIPPFDAPDVRQQQLGIYAQDRIEIDRLNFVLSGRYDNVWTKNTTSAAVTDQKEDAFSGRAGVVYNFDNGFSPYASVSRSFLPVVGVDSVTNAAFDPEEGTQYEAGFRYQPDFLGGAYIGASVFDLTRQNVVTSDGVNFNRQIGEVRSRGFELEAAGNITDDLKLIGAYTWYDLEIEEGNPMEIGMVPPGVPEQFASLWLDYTLPVNGPLEGLSIGAGVRYVGSSYADSANTLKVPDSVLADAAVRYEKENFSAALNVSNLFDKNYVATCNSATSCYYGEGRRVNLTLTYKW